jgi:hypothetical protein
MHRKFHSENPKERERLEGLPADDRIILKWILKKYCVRLWTGFNWLRIGPGVSVAYTPSGSTICTGFIDKLSGY